MVVAATVLVGGCGSDGSEDPTSAPGDDARAAEDCSAAAERYDDSDTWSGALAITDVRGADGRATATVENTYATGESGEADPETWVYVEVDGDWLLDDREPDPGDSEHPELDDDDRDAIVAATETWVDEQSCDVVTEHFAATQQ